MMIMFFIVLLCSCLCLGSSFEYLFLGVLVGLIFLLLGMPTLEETVYYMYSFFSIDSLSLTLSLLTVYLILLMWLSSHSLKKVKYFLYTYMYLMFFLLLVLLVSFLTLNYLVFYFFFESSLIPTLIIIMGWGYQPERLQAGVYFMLYTLFASLPLLLSIFYIYRSMGSLWMFNFMSGDLNLAMSSFFILFCSLSLIVAFLVKLPMFMTHLWLPKAHVEAPVAGSMILAGVLLKLGGYGVCRMLMIFFPILVWVGSYVIGLSIVGMIFVGLNCCRLNDMKALVAYSSVAHMALVIGGGFSFYFWGLSGALLLMVSHGLVSSGLFCLVNLFYERFGSRSLYMNKGLLNLLPILCLLTFLLCCFNIAAPPSINLESEIFLMISILSYDSSMMIMFPLGSFLGAVFTFYMFSYSQHGSVYGIIWSIGNLVYIEFHVILLHLLPVLLLILNSSHFMLL